MATNDSTRLIANPTACMYGVAVRSDGTFENVGVGSFDLNQAEELAGRLVELAKAISVKAAQQSIQLSQMRVNSR